MVGTADLPEGSGYSRDSCLDCREGGSGRSEGGKVKMQGEKETKRETIRQMGRGRGREREGRRLEERIMAEEKIP